MQSISLSHQCFTSIHLVMSLLAVLIGAHFIFVATLFSIAYINARIYQKEPLNRYPSLWFSLRPLSKTLVTIASGFTVSISGAHLIIIALFSLSECIYFALMNPIHNSQIALCYKIWAAILFWTAAVGTGTKYAGELLNIDGMIIWLFTIPFIFGIVIFLHNSFKISNDLRAVKGDLSPRTLKSHIVTTLHSLDTYIRFRKAKSELLKSITEHRHLCKTRDCVLKGIHIDDCDQQEDIRHLQIVIFRGIEELFQQALQMHPKSTEINLTYVIFLIERLQNYKKALIVQAFVDRDSFSFEQRLILARYTLITKRKIAEKNTGIPCTDLPMIRTLIGTEEIVSEFVGLMSTTTANKVKIMQELIQEKPDLVRQYELARQFSIILKKLRHSWEQIVNENLTDFRLLQFYKKFISLVALRVDESNLITARMATELACSQNSILDNANEISKKIPNELNAAIVVHSATGNLVYWRVSGQYAAFFGFEQGKLVNSSLTKIMPNGFLPMHDYIRYRLKMLGDRQVDSPYFGKDQQVFVKRKTGFIVSAISRVDILSGLPRREHKSFYFHQIRPLNQEMATIDLLCNSNYKIVDSNSSALLWMRETCRNFRPGVTDIQSIDPSFHIEKENIQFQNEWNFSLNKRVYSAVCSVKSLDLGKFSLITESISEARQKIQKAPIIYHLKYKIISEIRSKLDKTPHDVLNLMLKKHLKSNQRSIWTQLDPRLHIEETYVGSVCMDKWRSIEEIEGEKDCMSINYSDSIITKRLQKRRLINIENRELEIKQSDDLNSKASESARDIKNSEVFSDHILILKLNDQGIPCKNPEKIFKRIIDREKGRMLYKVFDFLQVAWALILVIGISLILVSYKTSADEVVGHISDHILIAELIEKSTYLNDHLIDLDFLSRNVTFRDKDTEYRQQYINKWTYSFLSYVATLCDRLEELHLTYSPSIVKPSLYKIFKSSYLSYPNIYLVAPATQNYIAEVPQLPQDSKQMTDEMINEREASKWSSAQLIAKLTPTAEPFIKSNNKSDSQFIVNSFITDRDPIFKSQAAQMFIRSRQSSLVEDLMLLEARNQFGEATNVTEDSNTIVEESLQTIIDEEGFYSVR